MAGAVCIRCITKLGTSGGTDSPHEVMHSDRAPSANPFPAAIWAHSALIKIIFDLSCANIKELQTRFREQGAPSAHHVWAVDASSKAPPRVSLKLGGMMQSAAPGAVPVRSWIAYCRSF